MEGLRVDVVWGSIGSRKIDTQGIERVRVPMRRTELWDWGVGGGLIAPAVGERGCGVAARGVAAKGVAVSGVAASGVAAPGVARERFVAGGGDSAGEWRGGVDRAGMPATHMGERLV